ncbi:hypothetical protein BSNK01_13340 [Bacillaceae bacterium]
MKWKICGFLIVLLLFGITTVYSAGGGKYLERFDIVRVLVNGEEVEADGVPAFQSEGVTMVPLRAMAEKLGLLTKYQAFNNTVEITKPIVNLVLARDIQIKDGERALVSLINFVEKGTSLSFHAYAKIAHAPLADELVLRFVMENPAGEVIVEGKSQPWSTIKGGNAFAMSSPIEVFFDQEGEYKVKLQMEDAVTKRFVTVGEASIFAK